MLPLIIGEKTMTLARYLRIWRELNAVTLQNISEETHIPYEKVRQFDRTLNNEIIWNWYISNGLNIGDYNNVKEKYKRKKKE